MRPPLTIAIADDHALFRQGVKSLLRRRPDLKVVAESERVEDVEPTVRRHRCDLVLLDLQMDRSSLGIIPALAQRTAVIVVTMSERPEDAVAAMRAGARAVVFKHSAIATLLEAIRAVAAGDAWMPASLQTAVVTGLRPPDRAPMTPREREIVRHVALGRRNAEVARALFISEDTVKKHLNAVFQKLGIRDRVQLTRYAIQSGIVSGFERDA